MKRVILRCFVMALLVLITLPLLGGRIAMADEDEDLNKLLDGDFAFTSTRVCVNVFFTRPDGTPNVPPGQDAFTPFPELRLNLIEDPEQPRRASTNTFGVRGILRYDGNGNVAVEDGRLVFILHQTIGPGASPARHNTFTCDGTYAVNPDGSFTQNLSCDAERIAGFVVGEKFVVTGVQIEGQIAKEGRTLLLSDTLPNVEDLVSDQRGAFKRICGRSGTAVLITED